METKQELIEAYKENIKFFAKEKLVYIDESGIEMNAIKERGWSFKGRVLYAKKSGKYYQRTNIIAGLVNNKPIAPMVFNGTCDKSLFESWVEQFLIKELKFGQVVIMDNDAFHKSEKTKQLIESVGCKLIFLPPYSPDLNPIEKFWANMKRWIRGKIEDFQNLFQAITAFFSTQTSL